MRLWEVNATKHKDLDEYYDAGIVLSGGIVVYDMRNDRLGFKNSTDRFLQAIELYKKGKIKKIIIIGGSGSLVFSEMKEAPLLKRYLLEIGIKEKDIITENESNNTYENAINTKAILDSISLSSDNYLLITSGYHMRRSMACFKKAGIIAEAYSTDRYVGVRRYDIHYLFIPSIDNLMIWDKLIHEIVGYIVYYIVGYI